jgi:glycosyl transferase family 25
MMPAYIIHASTYHARKVHMLEQIKNKNIDVVFVLEGDKATMDAGVIEKYFKGQSPITNAMSCSYKHLLSYEKIASGKHQWALILEDDVFLHKEFNEELKRIQEELNMHGIHNALISLEDSSLTFVERSMRVTDKRLYEKSRGRMAGAYLIDQAGARSVLNEVEARTCFLPIDWFHNHCSSEGLLKIYWTSHPIVTQGSLSGRISSTLEKKPANFLKYLSFLIQRKYKQMVYWFR